MNDNFLSDFRQAPRPEFAEALYLKLQQAENTGPLTRRHLAIKRTALILVVLCLIFGIVIAVSPTARAAARAAVDSVIAKITVKGTTVLINSDEPPTPEQESGESYSEIWTPLSPNDISANYPMFARLPAWVPAGYVLQERAALYYGSIYGKTPDSALFEWKNNPGETIQLQVMQGSCPNGPGASQVPTSDCTLEIYISLGLKSEPQVIAVNGQPGILYTGIAGLADLSGSVRQWNPSRWKSSKDLSQGMTMIWESGENTFTLTIGAAAITKAEALRLAESIP